ncbi:daptide-type RiPP biosynthesis dehydogenase [Streptomyces sp. QL37]|uniref:daptide-type RiPP biosynthesis dehydogenase n=1 Tax=Streptomyces sp. QL37 TaxID=2093747 RepID=UPI000CF1EBF7|nr:daptide-type RiPP biosynthesis dehydogenase [Streptomyces sp. QL37]PPQ57807.1 alcohol dehydrogenase [Streptomyces sp. QL37]
MTEPETLDGRGALGSTDELARLLRESPALGATRAALLVDGGVHGTEIHRRVADALGRRPYETLTSNGAGDLDDVLALGGRLEGAGLILALGGGSLLDRAKLASLAASGPETARHLTVPQRSGLIVLTRVPRRSMPLIAVPTTIGTGSETSAVACLAYPDAKRLVMGAALRPEFSVLDPLATVTLPRHLLVEGVLETFFRLVSPYVGDPADLPEPDARVEATAVRLLRLGDEIAEATREGGPATDEQRARSARLSARSHAQHLHDGRDPYAVKGWLIANELSTALGLRKMTAVAALLPPLWQAIDEGEERLGSARRLRRLWAVIRTGLGRSLPDRPAVGVASLIDAWGIERRVVADPEVTGAIAHRIVRAWGAGLPMLGGLGHPDVSRLLRRTVAAAGRAPDHEVPASPARAGVSTHRTEGQLSAVT